MKQIALRYGLLMFAGFILFFLFMHALGLSNNYHLRVFNGFIHISLIYIAIKEFLRTEDKQNVNYMSGVAMGMYASMIGVVLFSFFMTLFLAASPDFMTEIGQTFGYTKYLTPFTASLFIFVEGIVISLIGSYLVTRVIEAGWAKA